MSAQERWRLEPISVLDCVEWHVSTGVSADDVNPGYASIQGDTRLMYFAPRYLLAINHAGAIPPIVATAGAVAVDVTGKWHGYRLHGSLSSNVLARGVQTGMVLAGRNCAALSLFDCPVVLLQSAETSEVWVPASYAESLYNALNKMENCCD